MQTYFKHIAIGTLLFLVSSTVLLPAAFAREQFPAFPMEFYGTATLNGKPLPVGTTILAFDNETLVGEVAIRTAGVYGGTGLLDQKLLIKQYAGSKLIFAYQAHGSSNGVTGDSTVAYTGAFVPNQGAAFNLSFTKASVTIQNDRKEIALSRADVATTTIAIESSVAHPKINMTQLATITATSTRVSTVGALHMSTENAMSVFIPEGVELVSDGIWDGYLDAPVSISSATLALPSSVKSRVIPVSVVQLGSETIRITLSRAVRIVLPNQAGKHAGYVFGDTFSSIDSVCSADTQAYGDSLASGAECAMDSSADLIIWTKHFTTFLSYDEQELRGTSGFGFPKPTESAPNGTASGIEPTPAPTVMQTPEEPLQAVTAPEGTTEQLPADTEVAPQVLGAFVIADGTLVRGSLPNIFRIENQEKRHIVNLAALLRFIGQSHRVVSDEVLNSYPTGKPIYPEIEGRVVRAPSGEVYRITMGKKILVQDTSALDAQTRKSIINVSHILLSLF